MSFGFGVGDFLAVLDKAQKIRKEFGDAPADYSAIKDEFKILFSVLRDLDDVAQYDERSLTAGQKADLADISRGCQSVLSDLEKLIEQNQILASKSGGLKARYGRVWTRLKWDRAEVMELRGRIASNVGLLNAFNGRLTSDNIQIVKQGLEKLATHQEDEERAKIESWISPINMGDQHVDFFHRRQKGTGQWMLDCPKYQAWINGSEPVLFCPGIPGAGKTIISSVVIDDLCSRFPKETTVGVAFLYCDYKVEKQQTATSLLSCLLAQLVRRLPTLPDYVQKMYKTHQDKPVTCSETVDALRTAAKEFSRVYLVVDALDECSDTDGTRTQLLTELFELLTSSTISLFATSRPHIDDIQDKFSNTCSVEISAKDGDVAKYVKGNIHLLPTFIWNNSGLQDAITNEIVAVVKGMFLLAQLHLDSLRDTITPRDVNEALKLLPKGSDALELAYKDAIERIESQRIGFARHAKKTLSWIIYARRPLNVYELQHALAIRENEPEFDFDNVPKVEQILSVCAGLVTLDEGRQSLRLVHHTTQEYLERIRNSWLPDEETKITIACLTYLSYNIFPSYISSRDPSSQDSEPVWCDEASDWHPGDNKYKRRYAVAYDADRMNRFWTNIERLVFFSYAYEYWGEHARNSQRKFFLTAMNLLESPSRLATIRMVHFESEYERSDGESQFLELVSPLHLVAQLGITTLVSHMLERGFLARELDAHEKQPLSLACERGHEDTVDLLLEQEGVDVNLKDFRGLTPLSHASIYGHIRIVDTLLGQANIDADAVSTWRETPLWLASRNGNTAVVQALLQREDVDSNFESGDGMTPLNMAAMSGHADVVDLLAGDKRVFADRPNCMGQTPLILAAELGHESVVKILVDRKDVNLNSKDRKYERTPLSWAAEKGVIGIIRLLLQRDEVEIDSTDGGGRTPLSYASESRDGHETVRLLIERGANTNSRDVHGKTPLLYASASGNPESVRLLLSQKDIDVK